MRRIGNLYYQIPMYGNLCLAFWKAARGKQTRREVIEFRNHFQTNISDLQKQLLHHKPDIGHYRFFQVYDPKHRSICAALFPERVLHHAIMNICEPVLESYAIHDSYACRKEKGNRKAILRSQQFARKNKWYLKLDIRKYFDSIDHKIMIQQLSRRFKDHDLLYLFQQILETYHTNPGKGMPIGNLISQHLANFYLASFDHRIKDELGIKAYLRYMDDFILFSNDREYLKIRLEEIREFLLQELALELKDNIQLNRCTKGFPFLGYRIFPRTIRLTPGSRKRFVKKFRKYEEMWQKGRWTEDDMVRHMEALVEFTRFADARAFRLNVIQRFGVSF
ncbi:MAG: reverse transcriptase/maturase family protein [Desulfococcaceae bacterium]|nr:reverse transcriptase/maturase family protein [Desulfococcaceae bacterium]